ncbi:MAG: dCTP deaminase, partial [Psittacicella sp.]
IPVALKPKMKIGALSFEVLSSKALRPYSSRGDAKYKNQQSVLISKINED